MYTEQDPIHINTLFRIPLSRTCGTQRTSQQQLCQNSFHFVRGQANCWAVLSKDLESAERQKNWKTKLFCCTYWCKITCGMQDLTSHVMVIYRTFFISFATEHRKQKGQWLHRTVKKKTKQPIQIGCDSTLEFLLEYLSRQLSTHMTYI